MILFTIPLFLPLSRFGLAKRLPFGGRVHFLVHSWSYNRSLSFRSATLVLSRQRSRVRVSSSPPFFLPALSANSPFHEFTRDRFRSALVFRTEPISWRQDPGSD